MTPSLHSNPPRHSTLTLYISSILFLAFSAGGGGGGGCGGGGQGSQALRSCQPDNILEYSELRNPTGQPDSTGVGREKYFRSCSSVVNTSYTESKRPAETDPME